MDSKFRTAYRGLNPAQRQAVDAIDGPVLVLAGPGTGKTQLLSMRVANILRQTDATPSNILCLTFTDNAARNMRERLESIIGQPAYHVAIHTFHSFGSDIINQFPDYFTERQLIQQVDELGRYELLKGIFEQLPHSNPLSAKVGDDFVHLKDALAVISWLKQNAVLPHELHELITANQSFMESVSADLAETFLATPSPKSLNDYQRLLGKLLKQVSHQRLFGFPEYAAVCAAELERAIEAVNTTGRYAPSLTAWRNDWCQKDAGGRYVFKDGGRNLRKMHAVANVYQQLSERMAEQGLYDFDDMITEAVRALETQTELRLNLQERYQYVLVDEFQDTNKAQLRILMALGDNQIYENRPNIMAVGDDDQAIYAFQGAETSNMVAFAERYRDVKRITLEDNYRSTGQILNLAQTVATQITDRLTANLPENTKRLKPRSGQSVGMLDHTVFSSELAQYDWIAAQIQKLITQKTKPENIAVIAPRHKYLERLMPYLGNRHIPVAYERRENILDSPLIIQLLTMAKLITAIADNQQDDIDALMAEVLGYDFWNIPAEILLKISLDCYDRNRRWLPTVAEHAYSPLREITAWLIQLARRSSLEPLEYMLDNMVGSEPGGIDSEFDDLLLPKGRQTGFISPLRAYYFTAERYEQATDAYLTLLGQLSTLRQRLRQWQPNRALYLKDLVEFANLHQSARLKIIDTNPHTQTTNAVQVMTAYKAKGLEFDAVFVINAQDEVWGPTSRHQASVIALPKNLPIAPAGDSDNDKLRLLFVALSRARHTLRVTSYTHSLDNKLSPGLSFIGGNDPAVNDGPLTVRLVDKPPTAAAIEILSTDWAYRFRQVIADKPALFEPILANYKLSVTHLNNFVDIRDGGPDYFLAHNLLRFPEAPSPSAAYGDAMHKTLQWAHAQLRVANKLPTIKSLQSQFADLLARKHLKPVDHKRLDRRGKEALETFFKHRRQHLSAGDLIERGFNNEGAVVGQARLSGKIDKLGFGETGQATVVDFKTGRPANDWQGKDEYERIKLHKYRQQLLFYKLLVENSASFAGKVKVSGGEIEFLEPDDQGRLADNLKLTFEIDELRHFERLINAVWQHITDLDFPDIKRYPRTLRGINQFEQDLIDGKI